MKFSNYSTSKAQLQNANFGKAKLYCVDTPMTKSLYSFANGNDIFYCGFFSDKDLAQQTVAEIFGSCSIATTQSERDWSAQHFPNGLLQWRHNNSDFNLLIPAKTSDFRLAVWQHLLTIPVGRTKTYGQLATDLGIFKCARAVGNALAANLFSFLIPCHRVLASDGLGGYRWGIDVKQELLSLESQEVLI